MQCTCRETLRKEGMGFGLAILLFPSCNLVCKNVLSKTHHFECLLAAVITYQSAQEGGKKITLPHSHMYQSDSEKESNHTSIKSLSIQNRSQCFTIAKAGDRQRDKQTIQRQSFCHSKFINFQTLEEKPFWPQICATV
jgi:hypothetical protein